MNDPLLLLTTFSMKKNSVAVEKYFLIIQNIKLNCVSSYCVSPTWTVRRHSYEEDVLNKQKVLLYSHKVFLHAKICEE